MGRLDRLMRPFARRASGAAMSPLDQRLESLAARLEKHTVNLAEHQAQLRDESLRAIVSEMRSNSAFLADTAVALERAEGRDLRKQGAAIRPVVHELRPALAAGATVVLAGAIDRSLVDELVAHGHAVVVVDPAMEYAHPAGTVVVPRAITDWEGPTEPVMLVVWHARLAPSAAAVAAVRSWIARDGRLVFASPTRSALEGFHPVTERSFVDDGDGLRIADGTAPALVVDTLRPR
jgi:hypothetical protein